MRRPARSVQQPLFERRMQNLFPLPGGATGPPGRGDTGCGTEENARRRARRAAARRGRVHQARCWPRPAHLRRELGPAPLVLRALQAPRTITAGAHFRRGRAAGGRDPACGGGATVLRRGREGCISRGRPPPARRKRLARFNGDDVPCPACSGARSPRRRPPIYLRLGDRSSRHERSDVAEHRDVQKISNPDDCATPRSGGRGGRGGPAR